MENERKIDLRERKGFDAPVHKQEDDVLGRWQFAKEIYGLAIDCPKDWSVRVGIYGDWGAGKSSVLSFLKTMAEEDSQILIEFDPWGYESKEELWREFVARVYKNIGTFKPPGRKKIRLKRALSKYLKIGTKIINAGRPALGQAMEEGLNLVKKYLSNTAKDLAKLADLIGNKRIIILIDDLDRASQALVSTILFALKELADIPGFSFIFAFDPAVIGKIMEGYNEGFTNGKKFLEKIIDYPRWLPEIQPKQIIDLAKSDINKYCTFVDKDALYRIADLLPANPRSIRQFIRYISLLEKHISRFYESELDWPVLLASNLLKTKIPEYSFQFFKNVDYWEYVAFQRIAREKDDDVENKFIKKINETVQTIGCSDKEAISEIERISLRLSSFYGLLTGNNIHKLSLLAEEPIVVTSKEFDELFVRWRNERDSFDLEQWMKKHGEKHGFGIERVYSELFEVSIARRINELAEAADTIQLDEMGKHLEIAEIILKIISILTFKYGKIGKKASLFSADQFKLVSDMIRKYYEFDNIDKYREIRRNERDYLIKIVNEWNTGTIDIIRILKIGPVDEMSPRPAGKIEELLLDIKRIIIPRFVEEIISKLKVKGYAIWNQNKYNELSEKWYLCVPEAELWKTKRKDMLELIDMSVENTSIHENIYNLFQYYDHIWRYGHDKLLNDHIIKLLSDEEILNSLWKAMTCKRINPRFVGSMEGFPEKIRKDYGISLPIPEWWPSIK